MKKIGIILTTLCLGLNVMAEDVLQVVPFSTQAGIAENDWEEAFSINMTNTYTYSALQFDLYLPEGMTLIEDGPFDFNSDRFPGKIIKKVWYPNHDIDITNPEPGHYFVKVYNTALETIDGTEGELFSVYYLTSPDMKPGYYPIYVKGTVLGIDGHNGIYPENSVSWVKIGKPETNVIYDLGEGYVPSFVESEMTDVKNVVVNGVCENLVLVDDDDYIAADGFTATSATYNGEVIESMGYKTLVLPYDCAVPAGFKAWEVASVDGNVLNMQEVTTITADKPVILEGNGTVVLAAENVSVSADDNALENAELVGTYKKIDAIAGSYVLQNHEGEVAFYHVESVQPKVGAFRAYLKGQASGSKKMLVNFGVTTAIMDAETGMIEKIDAVYTVDGKMQTSVNPGYNVLRMKDGSIRKMFNK